MHAIKRVRYNESMMQPRPEWSPILSIIYRWILLIFTKLMKNFCTYLTWPQNKRVRNHRQLVVMNVPINDDWHTHSQNRFTRESESNLISHVLYAVRFMLLVLLLVVQIIIIHSRKRNVDLCFDSSMNQWEYWITAVSIAKRMISCSS